MNVFDLFAKLELDSSEYEKGLSGAQSKAHSFASGVGKTMKVGAAAIGTVATAVAGTGAAFVKGASDTAKYADNIDKMSQKLGLSTEAYQEWDYVLKISGTEMSNMSTGLKTLTNKFDDAKNGGEGSIEMFEKLGLSMDDIKDLSREELFSTVITQFQGMEDSAERAALANDFFGKSGQELAPLFNTTAEETKNLINQVHDLGGVMSDDAVKSGANFQDNLTKVKTAVSGLKNNLMTEFLPSLSTIMDGFASVLSGDGEGMKKLEEGIATLASKLSEKLPKFLEMLSGIAEGIISALPKFFDAIAEQLPVLIEKLVPSIITALVSLAEAAEKALPKIMDAIEKNIGTITQGITKIVLAIGKILIKVLPKLIPTMLKIAVELLKELTKAFTENASSIISGIMEVVMVIVNTLTNPETLTTILECAIQIILALTQGILENLPMIIQALITVVANILSWFVTDGFGQILDGALELFKAIGDGLLKAWDYITGKIGELFGNILGEDGIGGWISDLLDKASGVFEAIGDGLMGAWDYITGKISEFGEKVWGGIKDAFKGMWEFGKSIGMSIWRGIKSMWGKLKDALNPVNWVKGTGFYDEDELKQKMSEAGYTSAEGYVEGQEQGYDINSPSKKMAYIGRMVMAGFNKGIEEEEGSNQTGIVDPTSFGVVSASSKDSESTTSAISSLMKKIEDLMANQTTVIPVYIGNKLIDEIVVDSHQNVTLRSGGQVNV